MNKVHAKRLLKLADYLDTVPRKEFDYGFWCVTKPCGTSACALGHACTMPAFRRLGARLVLDFKDYEDKYLRPTLKGKENTADSLEVGQELFGLGVFEFEFLFTPDGAGLPETATPKQVAKHIRKFVKSKAVGQ